MAGCEYARDFQDRRIASFGFGIRLFSEHDLQRTGSESRCREPKRFFLAPIPVPDSCKSGPPGAPPAGRGGAPGLGQIRLGACSDPEPGTRPPVGTVTARTPGDGDRGVRALGHWPGKSRCTSCR